MTKNILFLLIIAFVYQNQTFSHERMSPVPDEFKAEKVAIVGVKYHSYHLDMLSLISKDMDVTGVDLKEGYIDLAVSQSQWDSLKSSYELVVRSEKNMMFAPDQDYKNPQEIEDFLKTMNDSYPEISKLVSIGNSVEAEIFGRLKFLTIQKLMKLNRRFFTILCTMHVK